MEWSRSLPLWGAGILFMLLVLPWCLVWHYRQAWRGARQRRRWQEERASLALAGAGLGVWEWRPEARQLYWSPAVFGFYGLEARAEVTLEQWLACLAPEQAAALNHWLGQCRPDASGTELTLTLPRGGRLRLTGTWLNEHRQWRLVGMQQDITHADTELRRMSRQAYLDRLTGLPNRNALLGELEQRCRESQPGVLVFLDLDGFKAVNDRHGHEVGDALLLAVAERLSHTLRLCDRIYRLGGDEFVIWLQLDTPDDIRAAERVAGLVIRRLGTPFQLTQVQCRISSSLGLARYPADGDQPGVLLNLADQAMYQAKRSGKGCFVWAGESVREITASHLGT